MISDDSGVKFFDRKFVAANLRSQLRCPKCTREYSHRHSTGQAADNHRPFLLPCGHNMCEFCISKHRQQQDFKCAVCCSAALPTINAKDPNGKRIGNIRDYYELNYHVLGETNSLDYYRRYSVDSVNNSLSCSSNSSKIVQETKCSECSHNVAAGDCKQCNAFYCVNCFETVHKHSRVLKTHVFQLLNDQKGNASQISVGNDTFRLPTHFQCKAHNAPKSIYCVKCKRVCCEVCVNTHHGHHKRRTLAELNHRYVTEIPAAIQALDTGILNINNAQAVVKNYKKRLGDFADETLATISEHFRLLHGKLQVAELQTVEMLRESSMAPQITLNLAMSQLNGYETVLKTLQEALRRADGFDTPQNVFLSDVIRLVHDHLENIPTNIQVSKFDQNPFDFSISRDNILGLLEKHFECKFVDPNIEVHFNNEYDYNKECKQSAGKYFLGSSSESSWKSKRAKETPQTSHAHGKKQKRLPKIATNTSSSTNCSTNDRQGQRLDDFRPFSIRDLNKCLGVVSKKQVSPVGDWFRTDAIVRVRTINSPEDFYVQCIHAAQSIREQLEAVVETAACRPPESIVVGEQYIAYHTNSEMDRCHRALIRQKAEQRDMYNVFLPDVGVDYQVHSSNFLQLPARLAKLPYAAVHCSLNQLMPAKIGADWEPEHKNFLKRVVQNNSVHIKILRAVGPQLYEVDLITNNYESQISVRESFLYTGLARARQGFGDVQTPKPLPLMALQSQRLPRYVPQVGTLLRIQMLHVNHPQEFFVMPHEMEQRRRQMQSELQSFMTHICLSQLESIYLGRRNLGCVLQLEDQWHRGCIESLLADGFVMVRLVDTGASQKLFWDQLFVLPPTFWTQELAIKCSLADVTATAENGYTWPAATTIAFQQLISNPKLHMEVISVRDEVAHVALNYTRSNGDSTNVAAMLVAQKHCQSSGESSNVNQPQPLRQAQLDADTLKLIEQGKAHLEPSLTVNNKDKSNRTEIVVLHVEHPGEFYVTMELFLPAIADLERAVQSSADMMYEKCAPKHIWQPGDMCYVKTMANSDQDILWHRGQIVDSCNEVAFKYNVRLRDIGELKKGVPANCLATMDEEMRLVANTAACCHLFGIVPNGTEWSPEAIELFQAQLQAHCALHISSHGREGDSMSVILWGSRTEISGPFSPVRIKYTDINEMLVKAGYALRKHKQPLEMDAESSTSSNCQSSVDSPVSNCLDKMYKSRDVPDPNQYPLANLGFQHNDEMPPMELLNDFNARETTILCTKAPQAWLEPRECTKGLFTALATNVNKRCEIYLSMASDEPYIKHMRDLLVSHFQPMLRKQMPTKYVVGQPVVVTYHLDNLIYRGIVKSKLNEQGEHSVYYVDYGNVEEVKPSEMLPYAPFPQLKAMCWPVGIFGVKPKQQKYSLQAMDAIHHSVVMKLSNVRVVEEKGTNGLPLCQINVGSLDISTMMINNDLAVRLPQRSLPHDDKNAMECFKIFDQLHRIGDTKRPQEVLVENKNTTLPPPPSKKRLLVDSKEMQRLECDEDFDCNEEAAKQKLHTSVNFEKDDSDNDDNDDQNCADGFSDDYVIEEIDEGIVNEDDEDTASPKPDPFKCIPGEGIDVMDQLRRRVQLRFKDRLESSNFLPMDTSTQRSFQDTLGCFKPQYLPTGVNNFSCSIDKVLSSTELQISPMLTEFAKQELVLAQETSALIRDAVQLFPVKPDTVCLARFAQNNQWYRAIIKELHQVAQKATVCYIDFHDTEIVPYKDLKVMPKQLFMFPQRSFRVQLHGIRLNQSFAETSVRQALEACLCKYPTVYARVYYPRNLTGDSDGYIESDQRSAINRHGIQLLEVDIFENKNKTELLYKPLIDSRMYLLKLY